LLQDFLDVKLYAGILDYVPGGIIRKECKLTINLDYDLMRRMYKCSASPESYLKNFKAIDTMESEDSSDGCDLYEQCDSLFFVKVRNALITCYLISSVAIIMSCILISCSYNTTCASKLIQIQQ